MNVNKNYNVTQNGEHERERENSKSMNEGETFNSCYEEGFQEVYGDAIRACYHDDESSIKRVH